MSYKATFISWLMEKVSKKTVLLADTKTQAKWVAGESMPAEVLIRDYFITKKMNAVLTVERMKGTKDGRRTNQVAKERHIKFRLDIFAIDVEKPAADGSSIVSQMIASLRTAFAANPYSYTPLVRLTIDDGPWDDNRIVSSRMLYNSTMVILYKVSVV